MSELTDDRLLPCPFCGVTLEIRSGKNPYGRHPKDSECILAAHAINIPFDVARWNRRAAASTSTEAVGVKVKAPRPDTLSPDNVELAAKAIYAGAPTLERGTEDGWDAQSESYKQAARAIGHIVLSALDPGEPK